MHGHENIKFTGKYFFATKVNIVNLRILISEFATQYLPNLIRSLAQATRVYAVDRHKTIWLIFESAP